LEKQLLERLKALEVVGYQDRQQQVELEVTA
jgi:hypothetical protein